MAHEEHREMYQRLLDLGKGLAIYRANIELTREQDKNARIMEPSKFERLAANIEGQERLESLPFTTIMRSEDRVEFPIISGHHRIRAARKANVTELYLLVDETELTTSEIISKQLAHNALAGFDDQQILADLYASIEDLDAKIASGLTDQDMTFDAASVAIDEIDVTFDYEIVDLMFLRSDFRRFNEAIDLIVPEAHIYLADKADFERFKDGMTDVAKRFSIRNASAIIARWIDIIEDYCRMRDDNDAPLEEEDAWIGLASILGNDRIPVAAAKVLALAVERMRSDGTLGDRNLWQAVEYLSANYLAEIQSQELDNATTIPDA